MFSLKKLERALLMENKIDPFLTLYDCAIFIKKYLRNKIASHSSQFYYELDRYQQCIHITRFNCCRVYAYWFKVMCITLDEGVFSIKYHKMYKHHLLDQDKQLNKKYNEREKSI